MDGKLVVNAGLRAPFFKRDLNNFCSASSAGGFVECFGARAIRATRPIATLNPTIQGPQQRVFKYDAILPNVGFTYDFMPRTERLRQLREGPVGAEHGQSLQQLLLRPGHRRARRPTRRRPTISTSASATAARRSRPSSAPSSTAIRTAPPRPSIRSSTSAPSATSARSINTASTATFPTSRSRSSTSMCSAPR